MSAVLARPVQPITVLARWRAAPEHVAEVLDRVAVLRQQSLAEPGCLGYEVFRSADEPCALLLLESYRDDAALLAHRSSPHFKELLLGHIAPMLWGRQVELLGPR